MRVSNNKARDKVNGLYEFQDELRKLQEMTTGQLKKMYMSELIRRTA